MANYFLVSCCVLVCLPLSSSALGGGLGDVGGAVSDAGGKLAETGSKMAEEGGSKLDPKTCDIDDSTWNECPEQIDSVLKTLRNVLEGKGNPMVINTSHQFCEYIQIHNLDTLKRNGKCGSRKCLDGKEDCFDQKLACGVTKMKFDCAFHTIEALKQWVIDQGFSLPPGISKLIKRAVEEEQNQTATATPSSSGSAGRYFLHAEGKEDCSVNMLLKLDWNSDESPKVEDAGYSTGGFANLHISWSGDTAAASFLEWLTQTAFIRAFFGVLVQFALLFIMPGILRDKALTQELTTLNCGD